MWEAASQPVKVDGRIFFQDVDRLTVRIPLGHRVTISVEHPAYHTWALEFYAQAAKTFSGPVRLVPITTPQPTREARAIFAGSAYDKETATPIGDITVTITWHDPAAGSFTIGPAATLNIPLPAPHDPFTAEISAPGYQTARRQAQA